MAALDQFLGTNYKLVRENNNYEEVLKELGVPLVIRKVEISRSPTITLTRKGDVYILKTASDFLNSSISFKEGKEFEEHTQDGRVVKSTITISGNIMHHVQKGNEETAVLEYTFEAEKVVVVMTVNGVCTRIYKKV